jgi:hypothetical protein
MHTVVSVYLAHPSFLHWRHRTFPGTFAGNVYCLSTCDGKVRLALGNRSLGDGCMKIESRSCLIDLADCQAVADHPLWLSSKPPGP